MSSYSDLILSESSLQSYWRVDETSGNALDLGPGAISGTYSGTAIRAVPGLLGLDGDPAFQADRTKPDSVNFGTVYNFNGVAQFSAEFWIRPLTVDGTVGAILSRAATSNLGGWDIDMFNGGTRFHRFDSAGTSDTPVGAALTLGKTHHVVVTYDGSFDNIYINTTLTQVASTRSMAVSTNALRFGEFSGGGSGVTAVLDELAIYNTALTPTQVAGHYILGSMPPQISYDSLPFMATGRI